MLMWNPLSVRTQHDLDTTHQRYGVQQVELFNAGTPVAVRFTLALDGDFASQSRLVVERGIAGKGWVELAMFYGNDPRVVAIAGRRGSALDRSEAVTRLLDEIMRPTAEALLRV